MNSSLIRLWRISDTEIFAAATTNYKTKLTTTDIVRYNGILYDITITCIDTFEGKRGVDALLQT